MIFILILRKIGRLLISRRIAFLLLIMLSLLLVGIYHVEKEYDEKMSFYNSNHIVMFDTPQDVLWWGIVTSTTIGYGDISPRTDKGKTLAIIYIIVTLGLLSEMLTRLNQQLFITNHKKMHGQIASDATDHIIIYGSKLDECAELIKEIDNEFQGAKEIVFMSENKQIPPEIQKLQDEGIDVDYISGKPDNQSTLELANIQQAKSFILLTEGINSDNKLISYIMKVRLMRTDIFIIAEICDSRNYQPIFKKAGVNKIIDSGSIGKNIITRTLSDQIDVILQDILGSGDGHEIYRGKIDSKRIDKPFGELKHHYADSHISVLAVVDIGSDMLHYNAEHILSSKSEIFYLADERLDSI